MLPACLALLPVLETYAKKPIHPGSRTEQQALFEVTDIEPFVLNLADAH